jgi:hypothetical protein
MTMVGGCGSKWQRCVGGHCRNGGIGWVGVAGHGCYILGNLPSSFVFVLFFFFFLCWLTKSSVFFLPKFFAIFLL